MNNQKNDTRTNNKENTQTTPKDSEMKKNNTTQTEKRVDAHTK